ncbi:hypothetical protein [Haloferax mucosum]|uniref:hypothetical protein n=1 Tax=Haloferax mucosum TaxID=403181 RepID=UPI000325771B|nr:hypothetical protein [Haloferax mucosum]
MTSNENTSRIEKLRTTLERWNPALGAIWNIIKIAGALVAFGVWLLRTLGA